jgi:hypothetical protein
MNGLYKLTGTELTAAWLIADKTGAKATAAALQREMQRRSVTYITDNAPLALSA